MFLYFFWIPFGSPSISFDKDFVSSCRICESISGSYININKNIILFLFTDLLLAAEIGKTLLEKNRELEILLKTTQEYADEKAAQADVWHLVFVRFFIL